MEVNMTTMQKYVGLPLFLSFWAYAILVIGGAI